MTRLDYRRLVQLDSQSILDALTARQYLNPREAIGTAAGLIASQNDFPAIGVTRSLQSLDLDPSLAIGRLRRTELAQLARTVYRNRRVCACQPAQTPAEPTSAQLV